MAKRPTGRAAAIIPAAKQKFRTADSFQNFIARVGHGTGNQGDGAHYGFNPVTRNRLQMEWAYRGSWVVGRVVDCVARDMTRERIDINTDADTKDVKQFDKGLARLKMWSQLCLNIKWARLYGGSCAFMMIDGQDPKTPLRPEMIGKGQFKGLLPMDRWLLSPSLQELVSDYGPHFGKPKFYQTVPDSMGMPLMTIHHTRMVRLEGVELPYWQKISENLWGQSVLERMWDRLLAFDSTTTGVAQLVYKAHLRTLKIEGLRDTIGQGGAMMNGVLAQVNMIRAMQTNEGLTLLDLTDEFDTHSYTFAGLDNVLVQFGEQLCGAVEIPAVRMFGQSPAGFNTGDSDLRSYYDSIKQNQEADLGPELETVYKVAWLSEFGYSPPDEFDLEFEHLWQMDELQKAQVTKDTEASISDAYEKQIIDRDTAMRELKALGREVGTFALITDEDITAAEADPAPTPEALGLVMPEPEPGLPGAGEGAGDDDQPAPYDPKDAKPFKALDAAGVPQHKETGRFTFGMGLSEKRFDEKGKKDPEGEWTESPLDPVKTKSMREAIQAAHPHTVKAYGEETEIEPWKLQGPQKLVNVRKVGEYRRDHGDPITVVKRAGEHGIVDGHHRAVAAHLQGRTVAATLVDMDRAFAEAADQDAANPGLGQLGALHIATQLRLKNPPKEKTKNRDASWLRRLLRLVDSAVFKENEHPRDNTGKFAEKASTGAIEWKKIGEKKGSNEGGTYELTDPATGGSKKFYVKFSSAGAAQMMSEKLSADLAQKMGVRTTKPEFANVEGKSAIVSELQDIQKVDWNATLPPAQHVALAKMYYVAAITKNWDVLGLDSSNIQQSVSGDLVQLDTGGSFEFRAQGSHKPYGEDVETELYNFMDPKFASGKVFSKLRKVNPAAFKTARAELSQISAQEYDAIFANSGLSYSDLDKLKTNFKIRLSKVLSSTTNTIGATPQVAAKSATTLTTPNPKSPKLEPLDPVAMAKMKSGTRIRHMMRVAHQEDGMGASNLITQVIKVPPPPLNDKNRHAVERYVSSSGGLNGTLRSYKGDLSAMHASSEYKAQIETLDEMFKNARDYSINIELTRGLPKEVVKDLKVGDTFVDHGYSSTSFSKQKAKSFGPNAQMEVRLPQGFKFLSVPSFAKAGGMKMEVGLAMSEAEAILPRGCGFKVREIKQEKGRAVYHVDAVFSSVQPPREKWVSSLTEKRTKPKLPPTADPAGESNGTP